MTIHESVTTERVIDAVARGMFGTDNIGFCVACGDDVHGVEPDARKYRCESCNAPAVYGAEEMLFYVVV